MNLDADGHCPDICPTPIKSLKELDQHNEANIGALKGVANVGIAGENMFLTLGESSQGPIPLFQPSNEDQAAGMIVGGAIGMAASVMAPEVGGGQTLVKGEQLAASAEKGASSTVPKEIPAGPSPRPTAAQQRQINEMGETHGCSTCPAKTPGTKSGDWVGDHQPSTSVKPPGNPQTYRPQCLTCSRRQGGQLRAAQAKAAVAARRAAAAAKAAKKQQQTN